MKPSVIRFNGAGQPTPQHVATGQIAILVQGTKREVVRIELLPPDDFGPTLHPASNQEELDGDIELFWKTLDASELSDDRDWVIECPKAIASKAAFK